MDRARRFGTLRKNSSQRYRIRRYATDSRGVFPIEYFAKGDHEATAQTFESWNKGVLDSYLIGITAPILRYKDTDGKSLIDKIADRAGQKGTGKWSIEAAIDSGTTLSVTAESVLPDSYRIAQQSETKHIVYTPKPIRLRYSNLA